MSQSSLPGHDPLVDFGEDLGHDLDNDLGGELIESLGEDVCAFFGENLGEDLGVDYYQTASTLPFCSRQSWFIKDR